MSRGDAMTITLTPEIEQALTEKARRLGKTPEHLALQSLRERFVAPRGNEIPDQGQGTLADFLAGYIGILDSSEHVPGGAQMSVDSHRKFAEMLRERRRVESRRYRWRLHGSASGCQSRATGSAGGRRCDAVQPVG
jgi:hypothetical protein